MTPELIHLPKKNRWKRRGRARQPGNRKPSGDRRTSQPNYRAMAALQPHRAGLPADARLDQRAESALGRLALMRDRPGGSGLISEAQYLAGETYARIVGEYYAVIHTPNALRGSGRGVPCGVDVTCTGGPRDDQCLCQRRERAYADAYEVVMVNAGRHGVRALNRVCIEGNLSDVGIRPLWDALNALVKHFGIAEERR